MLSLSFVPILFKFCYAQSSTYPQTRLLICARKMFEETLAAFKINLKAHDLHACFFTHFCTVHQFSYFIISGKLGAKS